MTEEITPIRTYLLVYIVLVLLTLLTYGIAFIDLGAWNTVIALIIAVAKALLIILFFMHARYSTGMTRIVMAGGLLWLGILMIGTLDDLITRGWFGVPGK